MLKKRPFFKHYLYHVTRKQEWVDGGGVAVHLTRQPNFLSKQLTPFFETHTHSTCRIVPWINYSHCGSLWLGLVCVCLSLSKLTSNKCCKGFCFSFSWHPNWPNAAPSKPEIQEGKLVLSLELGLWVQRTPAECNLLTKLHTPVSEVVHSNNIVSKGLL